MTRLRVPVHYDFASTLCYVAHRVMELVGLRDDPRFATFEGRAAHRDEVEEHVRAWVAARTSTDVFDAFMAAEAAVAPVYTMADIFEDPHFAARGTLVDVDGVRMQGLVARFSATPGRIRHAGRALGADTENVLAEWGADATSPEEAG